jgi:hypothetical protein
MELTGRPMASLGASDEIVDRHRSWLEPHFLQAGSTSSLNFRSWIVSVDDLVIVIDPCNGNGRPNIMPMFDMLDIPFWNVSRRRVSTTPTAIPSRASRFAQALPIPDAAPVTNAVLLGHRFLTFPMDSAPTEKTRPAKIADRARRERKLC